MKKEKKRKGGLKNDSLRDNQDHLETVIIDELLPENVMIKNEEKFNPKRTRHQLASILVIALVITILVFGVLLTFVKPENFEKLAEFSRFSIAVLNTFAAVVIGFFFRDITDR